MRFKLVFKEHTHFHPSETLKPSQDDIKLTERLYHTSHAIGIKLLDHIIVAGDRYYSFMEMDKMPETDINFSIIAQEDDEEMEI